jgi:hypothetical protein
MFYRDDQISFYADPSLSLDPRRVFNTARSGKIRWERIEQFRALNAAGTNGILIEDFAKKQIEKAQVHSPVNKLKAAQMFANTMNTYLRDAGVPLRVEFQDEHKYGKGRAVLVRAQERTLSSEEELAARHQQREETALQLNGAKLYTEGTHALCLPDGEKFSHIHQPLYGVLRIVFERPEMKTIDIDGIGTRRYMGKVKARLPDIAAELAFQLKAFDRHLVRVGIKVEMQPGITDDTKPYLRVKVDKAPGL